MVCLGDILVNTLYKGDRDKDKDKDKDNNNNLANTQLGHLLTRSGLTHLEVPSMVSPGFFHLLVCSTVVCLVRYDEGFFFVCCNQFLLYSCILSKTGVILILL